MATSTWSGRVLRFGTFELDPSSGELRKQGVKVRLSEQPFQILHLLLDRPGAVVTRQEIRERLWSADTFVDFDVGLNSAIRKLRETLGDSAENPRFIETLPRRGYRFIAPVQPPAPGYAESADSGEASTPRTTWVAGGLILVVIAIGTLVLAYDRKWRDQPAATALVPKSKRAASAGVRPEAYDAYLKGVFAAGQQTYQGFTSAVGHFEKAVAAQPDFADGYSALAQTQLQFLFTGPLTPREVAPRAEAAARKALELDDTLAQAHRVLAMVLQVFYWQWEEGEKEFRRARQLGGRAVGGGSVLSLIRTGHFDAAIAEAEETRRLDPLSFDAHVNLGAAYRSAGDYERGIAALRRAIELAPAQSRAHFQLGITFTDVNRLNEAISEIETALKLSYARNPRFAAYLGYAYAVAGRRGDAREVLDELEARARHEYVSSFGIALIHDALGEREEAFTVLQRASEDRAVEFMQMKQYPPFKTIVSDQRYDELMRRVGLRPSQ
jgi:DNA-binding winged helix-turn-helix (wHTH) protein/tetratricopeptide (TPR) repeat protein